MGNLSTWAESGPVAVQAVTKYYAFGGKPVALRRGAGTGGAVTYLASDHLSSVSMATSSTGAVLSESRFKPFGEMRWASGGSVTDLDFTGQRRDGFGLLDYNARYYSPTLGRFLSADSLIPQPGNVLAWDRYGYSNNNPLKYTDPDGHCPLLVTALVGALVGFSVDILFQAVPQYLNGTSPLELKINWAEAAGATVAGAIAGGTLGLGTLVAAGAGTALEATAIAAAAGGVGNMVGNQIGTQVEASITTGSPIFSDATNIAAGELGWGDPSKMAFDLGAGALAGGIAEQYAIQKAIANSPKAISSPMQLTNDGTIVKSSSQPLLNRLGNPIIKPDFRTSLNQSALYKGLTSLSNWAQEIFTKGSSRLQD